MIVEPSIIVSIFSIKRACAPVAVNPFTVAPPKGNNILPMVSVF
jgi:hypothetical protein